MSEQEFENWLALLSGLLKLSPEQRQNISDELRSHLEERMEDLIDAGSSREEAIAAALAEFGDTAALAQHFTSIAHQQRRRLMRYTYGTIAAVTCAILVLAAFWPGPQAPLTPQGIAQSQPEDAAGAASGFGPAASAGDEASAVPAIPFQGSKERIEAKLAEPLPKVDFFQMTFRDVIFNLSEMTGLTIAFDPSLLKGEINPDEIVDLQFPENAVSSKTLLKLAFKAMQCDDSVAYTIRDNIVLITYIEETTEVVIYNCRDLIAPIGAQAAGLGDTESGEGEEHLVQFGGAGGFGGEGLGGGGMSEIPGLPGGIMPPTPEQQLIQVITGTIDPNSWSETGGPGSIQSINGLIVINHTREVHDQVKQLLQLLREAIKEGDGEKLEISN